jgi:hypothetical protein
VSAPTLCGPERLTVSILLFGIPHLFSIYSPPILYLFPPILHLSPTYPPPLFPGYSPSIPRLFSIYSPPILHHSLHLSHLQQTWLILSPVPLVENWIKEGAEFFGLNGDVRVREWERSHFDNRSGGVSHKYVWIIRESVLNASSAFGKWLNSPAFRRVQMLTTFADEAHISFRSKTSARSAFFLQMIRSSQFNALVTGTPYPLGPSTDALNLLVHLGGPFDEGGKWPQPLGLALSRLLDPKSREDLYIEVYRALIAPFCLRRDSNSAWLRSWIINRKYQRPVPEMLLPATYGASEDIGGSAAMQRLRRLQLPTLKNVQEYIDRADQLRFLAWSGIWAEIVAALPKSQHGQYDSESTNRQKVMERIIEDKLLSSREYVVTGRILRLGRLVKHILRKKERFIIVSDRLFLLTLVFFVRPSYLNR